MCEIQLLQQNSFVRMKKLRDDCKMDLERAMKKPQQHNTQ